MPPGYGTNPVPPTATPTGTIPAATSTGAPVATGTGVAPTSTLPVEPSASAPTTAPTAPITTVPEVMEPMVDPAILQAEPQTLLRLLTQTEYKNSVSQLFGEVDLTTLHLPEDYSNAGFSTVGAAVIKLNEVAAEPSSF